MADSHLSLVFDIFPGFLRHDEQCGQQSVASLQFKLIHRVGHATFEFQRVGGTNDAIGQRGRTTPLLREHPEGM